MLFKIDLSFSLVFNLNQPEFASKVSLMLSFKIACVSGKFKSVQGGVR